MIELLSQNINQETSLIEVIHLFEKMCQIPIDDDLILFETGVYDFTGEDLYYFSLVRQYPNDDEEYAQIHVDVLYKPNGLYNNINEQIWSDEVKDIFEYIKQSSIFSLLENQPIKDIEVYIDET